MFKSMFIPPNYVIPSTSEVCLDVEVLNSIEKKNPVYSYLKITESWRRTIFKATPRPGVSNDEDWYLWIKNFIIFLSLSEWASNFTFRKFYSWKFPSHLCKYYTDILTKSGIMNILR